MLSLCDKYLQVAATHLRQGRGEDALRALDAVLHMQPHHPQAVDLKVQIYRSHELFEQAADCLQDALQKHRDNPVWVLELADLLINRLHRPERALLWLDLLSEHNPRLSDRDLQKAYLLHAEALVDEEHMQRAWELLRQATFRFPENEELLFLFGWVALQTGKYYASASTLQKLQRINPQHADAQYYLGMAYEGLGEYKLMRRQYHLTYELDLRNPPLLVYGHREFELMVRESLSKKWHPILARHPQSHPCLSQPTDPRGFSLRPS